MLIHASGQIYPGFFLLTFGGSSHYAIQKEDGCIIFDPGASVHVPFLYKRLESDLGLQPDKIKEVFITHLHPERIAAIPYLRQKADIIVRGTLAMQEKLKDEEFVKDIYLQDREITGLYNRTDNDQALSFEDFAAGLKIDSVFPDSELITITEDIRIRCMKAAGHTEDSFAYLVEPYDFLVVDEGFGYFRGKDPAAPAGDWNLAEAAESIKRVIDVDLSAICFTNIGMITGQLVRTHLQALLDNQEMLHKVCDNKEMPNEEKIAHLKRTFYTSTSRDPLVHYMMHRSFTAVLKQLGLEA